MRTEKNVQVVQDFFAAIGSGDEQRLLSLVKSVRKVPPSQA
jgi:ketosteroid isomerase-like protein